MTHQDKIQKIREKCIEANPEINEIILPDYPNGRHRTIRLADVFLALKSLDPKTFQETLKDLVIGIENGKKIMFWNLKDDNIENQTPPTVNLILNLLNEK